MRFECGRDEQRVVMRYLHDIEGIKFGGDDSDQTTRLLQAATMSSQAKLTQLKSLHEPRGSPRVPVPLFLAH